MRTKGASKIIKGLATDVCHRHKNLGSISDQIMRWDLKRKARAMQSRRVSLRVEETATLCGYTGRTVGRLSAS